ncbi:MAG: hypothetical protein ACRDZ4_00595 [Egibacteraceae bacterium]
MEYVTAAVYLSAVAARAHASPGDTTVWLPDQEERADQHRRSPFSHSPWTPAVIARPLRAAVSDRDQRGGGAMIEELNAYVE